MSSTVLDLGDTIMNRTDKVTAFREHNIPVEGKKANKRVKSTKNNI